MTAIDIMTYRVCWSRTAGAVIVAGGLVACGTPSGPPIDSRPGATIPFSTVGTPPAARKTHSLIERAGSVPHTERSPEYRAGHDRGVQEADAELQNGKARIYVHGMRSSSDKLDQETGLNIVEIAGCHVDDRIAGHADGHNERIRMLIAERGAPSYSRRRWQHELFNLNRYLAGQVGAYAPRDLHIGGQDVRLPGGHIVVSMRPSLRVSRDGAPLTWDDGGGRRRREVLLPWLSIPRHIQVAPGPDGSDVIVFRWTFVNGQAEASALDLRIGDWLRKEVVGG